MTGCSSRLLTSARQGVCVPAEGREGHRAHSKLGLARDTGFPSWFPKEKAVCPRHSRARRVGGEGRGAV